MGGLIRGFVASLLMISTFITASMTSIFDGKKPIYPESNDVFVYEYTTIYCEKKEYDVRVITSFEEWTECYEKYFHSSETLNQYNNSSFFEENNIVVLSVSIGGVYKPYIKSIVENGNTLEVECGQYLFIEESVPFAYDVDSILITTSKNITQADVTYKTVRSALSF